MGSDGREDLGRRRRPRVGRDERSRADSEVGRDERSRADGKVGRDERSRADSKANQASDGRQDLGRRGEQLAAEHLERRGFRILERNYRTRWGELDIIAFDGRTLVFCEVKTRRVRGRPTQPLESVRIRKRGQVRRMAGRWLNERGDHPYATLIRFDAIGICFDGSGELVGLEHLEGAF